MEQKKKTKKLNILYRVIPLVCSLAIAFISIMPIKAYAAQFPITDYQTNVVHYTTFDLVNYSFPISLNRFTSYQDGTGKPNIIENGVSSFSMKNDQIYYDQYQIDDKFYSDFEVDVLYRPAGNNFISTSSLGGSLYTYNYNAKPLFAVNNKSWWTTSICSIQVNMTIRYFNSSLSEVSGSRQYSGVVYHQTYNNRQFPDVFPSLNLPISIELEIPVDAAYFQPYVYTKFLFSGYSTIDYATPPYIYYYLFGNNGGSIKVNKLSYNPDLDGVKDGFNDIIDQNNDMINQNQQILGGQNTMINQNQQIIGGQDTMINQNQQILGNQNNITDQNQQIIQNQNSSNNKLDGINNQLEGIGNNIGEGLDNIGQQNELLINGSPSDKNKVNESLQGFQQSDNKLNDLTDDLKVNQPSIDPEDVAVENIVDAAMMPIFTAPLMKLWESPIIVTVLTVVITLVMISFVFFGKKG